MFKKISWQNPLKLAKSLSVDENYQTDWLLLFSGLNQQNKESKSYLAFYPKKKIISNNFDELEVELTKSDEKYFGYFAYDLKDKLEDLPQDQEFNFKFPDLYFSSFHLVLEFDHNEKIINCSYSSKNYLDKIPYESELDFVDDFFMQDIQSNFTKEEYLEKVQIIKDRIIEGDLYQANLTRKFFGKIIAQNKFDLFLKLNQVSPGNYSSFLRLNDNYIISSSPELFLTIDKKGNVKSSPIKGTAPRHSDQKQDLLNKEFLKNCTKEQAENLMIVDLVRNDLSRTCQVNSIKVNNLFQINSYETLHHMSSDIVGKKDKKFSNLDVVKNSFPPASMTGTPKIKAMEVCSELEKVKRGIYSGAIGFLSNNEANLSVVIRTLIIQDSNFEFQVGGAITHGSKPLKEFDETINKAKGIAKTLNLDLKKLKKI